MGYLDNTGLSYLWGKLKESFSSSLSVSGRTVTLKSKSGATLSTITTQDTTYDVATAVDDGLMSSSDKKKLNGIYDNATKNTILTKTVTLPVAGWSNNSQTVAVSGVTANNLIIVSVPDNTYDIECTEQDPGELTFSCNSLPTTSVNVNVAILS